MELQATHIILLISLILAFFSRSVDSLNCYQCDSTTDPECQDEFDHTNEFRVLKSTPCKVLDAKYCVKTTGVWAAVVGTTRFCSSRDMGDQCQYLTYPDHDRTYRACIYTCSNDDCNTAVASGISAMLVLLTVSLTLMFTFRR